MPSFLLVQIFFKPLFKRMYKKSYDLSAKYTVFIQMIMKNYDDKILRIRKIVIDNMDSEMLLNSQRIRKLFSIFVF